MKILVTGAAGFIGATTVKELLKRGHQVVGTDNINSYYDTALKYARLAEAGISQADIREKTPVRSSTHPDYSFVKIDLTDRISMDALFESEHFDAVINLAGQAGVRYSIENPFAYVESNILGFLNILENCRRHPVKHLIYASSSSIYGMSDHIPYAEDDRTDSPVSLYAATKKSNELMAYSYSHLYGIPATGVRLFTVYGPWGRPDMAPFLFLRSILDGKPIRVFNHGNMMRDFTYIDDIVEGVVRIIDVVPHGNSNWDETSPGPATSPAPYRIYNIGNQHPTKLMDYISCIENATGKTAQKEFLPMQPGDVYQTYADSSAFGEATGFKPATPLQTGIDRTVEWFRNFYNI